jgi:hypothetical protein
VLLEEICDLAHYSYLISNPYWLVVSILAATIKNMCERLGIRYRVVAR